MLTPYAISDSNIGINEIPQEQLEGKVLFLQLEENVIYDINKTRNLFFQ